MVFVHYHYCAHYLLWQLNKERIKQDNNCKYLKVKKTKQVNQYLFFIDLKHGFQVTIRKPTVERKKVVNDKK